MTAGYSGTPLPRKLGVKDAHTVFLDRLPADVELGDLGAASVVRRLPRRADLTVTFHDARATLAARLPTLMERTERDGMVWVCWPKRASGVATDVTEDVVRDLALELGWVDVKVAAVDATWSALKLVRRLRDR